MKRQDKPNERNPLVLVVDDDMTLRFMAREALEQAGYLVVEADDGIPAVTAAATHQPDLILLDVMMPGMDGFTACTKIRALPSGRFVPILMMTGLDDLDSITRAYQAGATDFSTKPTNYLLLTHRVQYMLRAKQMGDELRASEARLANAQRIAKLGHWEWAQQQGCDSIHWSDEIKNILALPSLQAIDTFQRFVTLVHKEDRARLENSVRRTQQGAKGFSLELHIACPDGVSRYVHLEAEVIQDAEEKYQRLSGTLQDITERKRAEKKIADLAYNDKVTGLPNRILLRQQLTKTLVHCKCHNLSLTVLTISLNQFKQINDTFGHSLGDEILRTVAKRLSIFLTQIEKNRQQRQKPSGGATTQALPLMLAHLGGSEFVIFLTSSQAQRDATIMADRVITLLTKPFTLKENDICFTLSIGISVYPEDGADSASLIKHSGAALYHAKTKSGNDYKFYTSSMNENTYERISLETDLRKALEGEQFMVYFQPKVCIRTGNVLGMETLVRWNHPKRGFVSPADFIPVAEKSGLIIPLGEWILRAACKQVVQWQKISVLPPLHVAVNLSTAQFGQRDLCEKIAKILDETQLDARFLELEITESQLMGNVDAAIVTLKKLKSFGLQISIDDFGTGYSSLSYLKRFPISALKIDQSFIREIANDADDAAIVDAVIALSHSLRLKVIAEGVEDATQLELLRKKGCDIVQGYYYSRPLPPKEFIKWVYERQNSQGSIAAAG